MLARILGIIWIVLGLFWLFKPGVLKNRLQRKMSRRIRRVVYAFIFIFGIMITGSALKAPGSVAKVLGIVGMVIAIKAVILITSKTSEKMFKWLGERPVVFYRIWALFIIIVGVMLLSV